MKAIKKPLITTTIVILGISLLLDGRFKVLAAQMHGHGAQAFGHHPAMHEYYYVGFPWLGNASFYNHWCCCTCIHNGMA